MTARLHRSNQPGDLSPRLSACVLKPCGLAVLRASFTRATTRAEAPDNQLASKVYGQKAGRILPSASPLFGDKWRKLSHNFITENVKPRQWPFGTGVGTFKLGKREPWGRRVFMVPT